MEVSCWEAQNCESQVSAVQLLYAMAEVACSALPHHFQHRCQLHYHSRQPVPYPSKLHSLRAEHSPLALSGSPHPSPASPFAYLGWVSRGKVAGVLAHLEVLGLSLPRGGRKRPGSQVRQPVGPGLNASVCGFWRARLRDFGFCTR